MTLLFWIIGVFADSIIPEKRGSLFFALKNSEILTNSIFQYKPSVINFTLTRYFWRFQYEKVV